MKSNWFKTTLVILLGAMLCLIMLPIIIDLARDAQVSVWMSKLTQEGYKAWATPDGDVVFSGDVSPTEDNSYDIGSALKKWKDLFIAGDIHGSTGRAATLIVAASNSATINKEQADYLCDGTDDQVQIQAAIDALPTSGGRVLLLEGNYSATTITISSNVTLEGQGCSSVITLPNTSNVKMIVNSDQSGGNENIAIRNLCLDGNSTNQSFGEHHGIYFNKVTNSIIEGVYVKNTYAAGFQLYSAEVTISDCTAENTGDDGFAINANCYNTRIRNCLAISGPQTGLIGSPCGIEIQDAAHSITVINNVVESVAAEPWVTGINVSNHEAANPCYDVSIIGNTILVTGNAEGIKVTSTAGKTVTNTTVTGNIISRFGDASANAAGIKLMYAEDNTVTNNIVTGTFQDCIQLVTDADHNIVSGNIVDNTSSGLSNASGIHLDYADQNHVSDNNVKSTNIGIYGRYADYNSIQNNQVHDCGGSPWLGISGCDHNTFSGNQYVNNVGIPAYSTADRPKSEIWELIGIQTLEAPSDALWWNNLDSEYIIFRLTAYVKTEHAAGRILISFNDDSGTNYDRQLLYASGNVTTAESYADAGSINTHDLGNTAFNFVEILIQNRAAGDYKTVRGLSHDAASQLAELSGVWKNTSSKITKINLASRGGAYSFVTGSKFILEGCRE